jgi:transposase
MIPTQFAGDRMKRFVEGVDRGQSTLFPAVLDDYVGEDNPVRAIDVFVDGLDLAKLGFDGVQPLAMGRPAYHLATQLKIYIYGYLNRVQSSRRLVRKCQRNVELVWLTGRLIPDFKTIADFRKDTVRQSAKSAARSFCCAGASNSSATRARPSTAASSRR